MKISKLADARQNHYAFRWLRYTPLIRLGAVAVLLAPAALFAVSLYVSGDLFTLPAEDLYVRIVFLGVGFGNALCPLWVWMLHTAETIEDIVSLRNAHHVQFRVIHLQNEELRYAIRNAQRRYFNSDGSEVKLPARPASVIAGVTDI